MPIKNKVPVEVHQILKRIDLKTLQGLSHIARNQESIAGLRFVLELLRESDTSNIVSSASAFNSLDSLINLGGQQAFLRGRISIMVLLHSLIINSPDYLEKQMTQKEK